MSTTCGLTFESWVEAYNFGSLHGYFWEGFIQRRYKNLPPAQRRPYYKKVVVSADDSCIVFIVWTPEGKTRPHKHGGSGAKIHVLKGALMQDLFAVWNESGEVLEQVMHLEGEEFCEDPETVHRIGNASPFDWAVSLHLFEPPLTEMEVYDFAYNQRWTVKGDEDTMGEAPSDAKPIWPTKIPH